MAVKKLALRTGSAGLLLLILMYVIGFLGQKFGFLPSNCFFNPVSGCWVANILFLLMLLGAILLFMGGGTYILISITEKRTRK